MNVSSIRVRRFVRAWPLTLAILALLANPALVQATDIVRIEEDWELVVGVPSTSSDAPQVTCLISPVGNVQSLHAMFVVNHHDAPTFSAGGLEIQIWNGEELLSSKRFPNEAKLANPGETIRWTQVMRVGEEGLVFEIVGGSSTTWGNFGDEGTLKLATPTSLANLNGYSPEITVHQSGVSYAANRVDSLVLKRIRAYDASGTPVEDTTPRVVHGTTQ